MKADPRIFSYEFHQNRWLFITLMLDWDMQRMPFTRHKECWMKSQDSMNTCKMMYSHPPNWSFLYLRNFLPHSVSVQISLKGEDEEEDEGEDEGGGGDHHLV